MNLLASDEITSAQAESKPYSAYKDTGIKWLRKIPAHWEVKRLKDTVKVNPDVLSEGTAPDWSLQYLDIGNVDSTGHILSVEELTFEQAPSRARRTVRNGDTIISTVRTYLKAIALMESPADNLVASTGFAVLRPTDLLYPRFLLRMLQSTHFIDAVVSHSEGVGYPAISPTKLAGLPVWIPPLPEQQAIVQFLDRETAKIDALLAKKERLIELLQEKRAALIFRAVTKGLPSTGSGQATPNVPMKYSGVDWLGEIPAHWQAIRTKFVARLETGHTPSRQHPEYWEECTIPWVSLADVWQIRDGKTDYVSETQEKVSELGLKHSAARLLPKGTVMLSRTASVGFSSIMGTDMATTQDFVNWVCGRRIEPEYLLYVFRSMKHEFRRLTMGSTHQTIYMPDVGKFSTSLPPREEQTKIVEFIWSETSKIDALIGKVAEGIEKLKEYRTALISAAVTGKIDVRTETSL